MTKPAVRIGLCLALGWPATAPAPEVTGNLRATTAVTRNYEQAVLWGRSNEADGQTDVALRLIASDRPSQRFRWEAHVVQRLALSTFAVATTSTSNLFGAAGTPIPYRAIDTRWKWGEADDVDAWSYLDRAHFEIAFERADLTVGRQAITFGKAYFWNPLDVFHPFGSTQFDRDYKAGVDAVRLDTPFGDFSGATLVGVFGRTKSGQIGEQGTWYRSALLARAYSNFNEWDVAAQGGKILGGYQLGFAMAGELTAVAVRLEAAWFASQDRGVAPTAVRAPTLDDHFTAVIGTGRSFASGDLQLQAEYFHNGAASGSRTERFALVSAGRLQHVNRHVLSGVATYQLHPLLFGSLALFWGVGDSSWLVQPGLVYSAAEEIDVVTGAVVARGKRPGGTTIDDFGFRSEFGTYPDFYYVETKIYF